MRVFLYVIFSFIILGCTATHDESIQFKIDEQATQSAPWKAGSIVAQGYTGLYYDMIGQHIQEGYAVNKVFLGILPNGHHLVQEFYVENGKKHTDPYELSDAKDVTSDNFSLRFYTSIQGKFTRWYPNGNKESEDTRVNGKSQGQYKKWYANGQLMWIGWADQDRPLGDSTTWYYNGQKAKEGKLRFSDTVGKWQYWDMEGNSLTKAQYDEYRHITYRPLNWLADYQF